MLPLNSIVAVYQTQTEAETGVRSLQESGFDLNALSVVGREHESGEHVIGCYSTGGRMKYWGARGAFWNDIWKYLTDAATFVVPGIGRILVAGPLTGWMVDALNNAEVEDLSALGAGLYEISVPKPSIRRYESAIRMHKLLLIAHGPAHEVLKAKELLRGSRPDETDVHFAEEGVQSAR
jgi:hypothetical protein